MAHLHKQIIPKPILVGAACTMVFSIGLAAYARHAHLTAPAAPARPALAAVDLRFADRADGGITIVDAHTGRELGAVPPRENGFVRGVLRGMFRTRKLESLGRDGAFHLAREADGRLSLTDPATARRVDLDSFGPTNAALFAQLLVKQKQP